MIIKNIHQDIQETLREKERALSRKTKDAQEAEGAIKALTHADMASRTVFVRMASNKKNPKDVIMLQNGELEKFIDGGNITAAMRHGAASYTAVGTDNDREIRPLSGIRDISVEYKGGYKAIRRATVNWTAGSLVDLERLTPHFLKIGGSVMLDWGWVYPRNNNESRNQFIQQNSFWNGYESEHPINQEIFDNATVNILKNKGDYDAIGGIISNFDYKLNEDGSFDCSTIITSLGVNLFDSKRIDKDADTFIIKKSSQEGKDKVEPNIDNLLNAVLNLPRIVAHNYLNISNKDSKGNNLLVSLYQHIADSVLNTLFVNEKKVGDMNVEFNYGNSNYCLVKYIDGNKADVVITRIGTFFESGGGVFETLFADKERKVTTEDTNTGQVEVLETIRDDMFIRWGWFEDNILSRYVSYIEEDEKNNLLSVFRSVEAYIGPDGKPILDENGRAELIDVFIRNDKQYLIPKDPLKFILPGQTITSSCITMSNAPVLKKDKDGKWVSMNKNLNAATVFDKLMGVNVGTEYQFSQNSDDKYGSIRNVMINVKEIQKAFGIKETPDYSYVGDIFGTDKVNPPNDVKSAMKNLARAFSDNYHGYWNFEIVEDTFNKNVKVIDRDTVSKLTKFSYTRFKENTNEVASNSLGIYKFPAFTLNSMVKNQELSFKLPDSMAVTAMYGSKKTGTIDTTQNGSEVNILNKNDGDVTYDKNLKNIQASYLVDSVEGHKVGNSNEGSVANNRLTLNGSFTILANEVVEWWNTWSPNLRNSFTAKTAASSWKFWKSADDKKKDTITSYDEQQRKERAINAMMASKFTSDLQIMIAKPEPSRLDQKNGLVAYKPDSKDVVGRVWYGTQEQINEINKVKNRIDLLKKSAIQDNKITAVVAEEITKDYWFSIVNPFTRKPIYSFEKDRTVESKDYSEAYQAEDEYKRQHEALWDEYRSLLDKLQVNSDQYYYNAVKGEDGDFNIELFSAGHSIVRDRLFSLDKRTVELQNKHMLIPAELSLTVDGIGGVIPGDITHVDYITTAYNGEQKRDDTVLGPRTFFQIFNVTQTVSTEGWDTEFSTKMRMNQLAFDGTVDWPKVPKTDSVNLADFIKPIDNKKRDDDTDDDPDPPETDDDDIKVSREVKPVVKTDVPEDTKSLKKDGFQKMVGVFPDPDPPTIEDARKELSKAPMPDPIDLFTPPIERKPPTVDLTTVGGLKTTFRGTGGQNKLINRLVPAWRTKGARGSDEGYFKTTSFYNEKPEDKVPIQIRQLFWDNYCEMPQKNGISKIDVSTKKARDVVENDLAQPTLKWPTEISKLVKYVFLNRKGVPSTTGLYKYMFWNNKKGERIEFEEGDPIRISGDFTEDL